MCNTNVINKEKLNQIENGDEIRICSQCDNIMYSGYVIENGLDYYCSDQCLTENMTRSEYLELYADGEGDSYWTEW